MRCLLLIFLFLFLGCVFLPPKSHFHKESNNYLYVQNTTFKPSKPPLDMMMWCVAKNGSFSQSIYVAQHFAREEIIDEYGRTFIFIIRGKDVFFYSPNVSLDDQNCTWYLLTGYNSINKTKNMSLAKDINISFVPAPFSCKPLKINLSLFNIPKNYCIFEG